MKFKQRFLDHFYNMLPALIGLVMTLVLAFGMFVGIFGWAHLKLDFWPLDSSRIGPNLCASMALVILLIAHNEFVVLKKAKEMHENHRQALRDVAEELLHPTDTAEADIAAKVEEAFRTKVLDQLDETTPGGLGTIVAKLKG